MGKTKILIVGKVNRKGYTLIELALVVFLIGLMLVIAVPRVRDTLLEDGLKTTARRLMGAVTELRNDAVREQVDYVLHVDLNNHAFWTYSADMTPEKKDELKEHAFHFPEGVKIADIYHIGYEKQSDGEAEVRFFKKGYMQPTVIHFTQGDRYLTLVIHPFLTSIKTYDKYVDFEELSS